MLMGSCCASVCEVDACSSSSHVLLFVLMFCTCSFILFPRWHYEPTSTHIAAGRASPLRSVLRLTSANIEIQFSAKSLSAFCTEFS
jgi:hypothetical protein